MTRVLALVAKDLAELWRSPGVFLPAALTGVASILLPFFVTVIVPWATGEPLADSAEIARVGDQYRSQPGAVALDQEASIQAWIFQQFLVLLVLTPMAGAMSVAANGIIGEKLARTLEPLLATPISTFELLSAKLLGAFLPAMALTVGCFALYLAGVAVLGLPGVVLALLAPWSLAVVFLVGSLAPLAALQLALCVSSRVNDSRSAQQIGTLIILPVVGLLVAQLLGAVALTTSMVLGIAAGLVVLNAFLLRVGITLFDREAILTRWR